MSTVDVTNLQQVSDYSTLLLQSNLSNNVYFLDNTDTSGYVFEINAFDTSNKYCEFSNIVCYWCYRSNDGWR